MLKRVLVLFLVVKQVACFAHLNADGDFQFWSQNLLKKELCKKVEGQFDVELRYGNNASRLYYYYVEWLLNFKLGEEATLTPGYRFIRTEVANQWQNVYSPLIDLTLFYSYRGWKLHDRNRLQWQIPEEGRTTCIYRNRIELFSPWKLGQAKFNPFLFNEFFFVKHFGFSEDRLAFGGAFPFKNLRADALYMLRFQKSVPHWIRHNVLFIRASFSF